MLRDCVEFFLFLKPYDVILTDFSPTLGLSTVGGFSTAGEVVIPLKAGLLMGGAPMRSRIFAACKPPIGMYPS